MSITRVAFLAGTVLPGYFQGKRRAEEALAMRFPEGGVYLRPGFIYGTRYVGSVGIPLQAVGTGICCITGLSASCPPM
jgi:hypothetical protein